MAEKAFLIIVGGYLGHHSMKSFHNKILVVPLFNFLCFIIFLFTTGLSYRWSTMLVELSGLRQDLFQSHLVVSDLHFWQESCISQVIVGKLLIDNQVSLSGGGNYETGFTDSILAWNPEMEDWSLVGNMLVARYVICQLGIIDPTNMSTFKEVFILNSIVQKSLSPWAGNQGRILLKISK